MPGAPLAQFITGLFAIGIGATSWLADPRTASTRPFALFLISVGGALCLNLPMALEIERAGIDFSELRANATLRPAGIALVQTYGPIFALFESAAFITAFEWMRRVLMTVATPLKWRPLLCLRIAQVLIALNMLISVFRPTSRVEVFQSMLSGSIESYGLLLLYALPLPVALVMSGIAIAALLTQRPDSNETVRLRSLALATPFLMSGMFISLTVAAALLTAIGEIILLYGIFRYQARRGQRDQFISRFLSPQVRQLVQEHGLTRAMQNEQRQISIVFCDLRNFTAYSDSHSAQEVVKLLEGFYRVMGKAAAQHGGTVKDHAGDGILILVGAPVAIDNGPERAVRMAQAMQAAMNELSENGNGNTAPLGVGIGVATGPVVVGAIEAANRLEYVAVGDSVNRAARLCSKAAGGEICIDAVTREKLPEQLKASTVDIGEMQLKGFAEPVTAWSVAQSSDASAV